MTTPAIQTEGRRHYLVDLPYAAKDEAKSRGCSWDPSRRAWWTGKLERAQEVLEAAAAQVAARDQAAAEHAAKSAASGILAAHPAKLANGEWGIRVTNGTPTVGAKVRVRASSGKEWETTIASVMGDGTCTTPPRATGGGQPRRNNGWSGRSWTRSDNAPGGRRCSYCGARDCQKAWDPRALCDED